MISTPNGAETSTIKAILTKDIQPASNTTAAASASDTTFLDWLKAIDNQVMGTKYIDKTDIFTGEVMHNYPVAIFKPTPAEIAADAMTPEQQASTLIDNYLKYLQTEKGQRGPVNPAGGDAYGMSDWAESIILEQRVGYNKANVLLDAVRSGKITDHVPLDQIDALLAGLMGSGKAATAADSTAAAASAAPTNSAGLPAATTTQATLDGLGLPEPASAPNVTDAARQAWQDQAQILNDILDGMARLAAAIQQYKDMTSATSGGNKATAAWPLQPQSIGTQTA
ncbi:MAG: hypothetical protein ACP5J5_03990 [Dissulfurimicrobium sp.]|uniref:hypothetical protein n=1 Tax=Dissulfurimicrobium TaxID=1769732 RepID=UPI001EDC7BBD|nr:hypothetical protein [Dissulfurimicrobium hydrothermale]UKL13733.1 hypothetical protein LGS26_00150 [Dissulfurimicrobium hydrothermale]